MGRDWYSWGSSSTTKSSKRGQEKPKKYNPNTTSTSATTSSPSGCMCNMFNLFDFHHFHHSFTSASFLPDDPPSAVFRGTEAPRNSLEVDEEPAPFVKSKAVSCEDLNIQVGIQIRTKSSKSQQTPDSSETNSCSPGAKTPTLVARLMGLDLLPDHKPSSWSSPRLSSTQPTPRHQTKQPRSQHRKSFDGGTRSLPETPRISSARRSDVDQRFSLQINKDHMSLDDETVLSRLRKKVSKAEDQEPSGSSSSPSHYARQIVKQFKESVRNRTSVLGDITNVSRNRRDHDLDLLNQLKHSKHKSATPKASKPLQQTQYNQSEDKKPKIVRDCKKIAEERFSIASPRGLKKGGERQKSTYGVRNYKQEEAFVRSRTAIRDAGGGNRNHDKKFNKTALSNELLNISVPTLLPLNKDSASPSKFIQKQIPNRTSRLSRSSSHQSYTNENATQRFESQPTQIEPTNNEFTHGAVREYITSILNRTGSTISLNPSVFTHLEQFFTGRKNWGSLNYRCNRKLLFHLVEEILVNYGSGTEVGRLVDMLVSNIMSFSGMDCRVLEDIDALITKDWRQVKREREFGMREMREEIVGEIEKDMIETLISELV